MFIQRKPDQGKKSWDNTRIHFIHTASRSKPPAQSKEKTHTYDFAYGTESGSHTPASVTISYEYR